MNKLFTRIMASVAGFAMAIGVGVGVSSKKAVPVFADSTYTIGWGTASGTSGTYTNFTAVSGSVNGILSFDTAKNSSSTNPAYNSNNNELRLYFHSSGNGGSITITPASGVTFTGFVMTTSTTPSVKYAVDDGTAASVSASNNTYTVSGISVTSSLVIQNANTTNTQLRIKTIGLSYTSGGGQSSSPLSSIALSGTYPTSFTQGDEFSHAGMTVTATYEDESTANVTGQATFSGYNMNQIGNQTVTVSYTENDVTKTASYGISVNAPTYSVTYNSNGATSGTVPTDNTEYETGDPITVLGNTGSLAKDGYTWSGWSLNSDGSGTAYGPAYEPSYTVQNNDVSFYPIWTKNITPLPESGTFSITGTNPNFSGYGTNVAYTIEEDNTPNSEFGLKATDIMKNSGNMQFKASSGTLYSTTPLYYIRDIVVSGNNSSDAVIRYGKSENSGCDSSEIGTDNTYFKISNGASNARYWTVTVTYSLEAPVTLSGLRIASGEETVNKTYDDGESFDPSGLVIQAKWGDNWDEENNVVNDVDWEPNPLTAGTTSVTGTYTFGNDSESVTISGLTVNAPIVVDGDSNKPNGVSSSTNTSVGEGQINLSGVKYGYYALQTYNSNLEFNQNTSGAYIGNNETYGKFIKKIRVTLTNGNNFNKLTMYKGDSAIPGDESVSTASNTGSTRIYNFNNDSEYFALKLTTTGTWVQISKIEVFLGSNAPAVDTVSASIKSGTYYENTTLSASDFEVTVTWTEGKADTHPEEGFTWTVNGVLNGVLAQGNNNIVVSYKGVSSDSIVLVGLQARAKDLIESSLSTQSSLSYHYSRVDSQIDDTLNRELTGIPATNSYGDWSNKTSSSSAIYAGQSAGEHDAIQLRTNNNNSGVVTTASGGKASKITVEWNESTSSGRKVDIYGKNTAYSDATDLYSDATQGTKLGTIAYGTSTTLDITGDYEYIGIRSNSGALYLNSIQIKWNSTSFDFTNTKVRFIGSIDKDLWNRLDSESTIEGYGIMLSPSASIKQAYESVRAAKGSVDASFDEVENKEYTLLNGTEIKNFYKPVSSPVKESGNNYTWALGKSVENKTTAYTAVAYIRTTDDELVFLGEVTKTLADAAKDLLDADPNDEYDDEYLEGSLAYLSSFAA